MPTQSLEFRKCKKALQIYIPPLRNFLPFVIFWNVAKNKKSTPPLDCAEIYLRIYDFRFEAKFFDRPSVDTVLTNAANQFF